jgi:hypothetical protein
MPNSQKIREMTPDENFRELYKRFAQLNNKVSALLNPAWGSETGLIPTGHPLYESEKPEETQEQDAPVDWRAVIQRRERDLKAVGEAHQKTVEERDGAYRERAHLVALLAALTDHAVIAPALDVEEPGWWIVYLSLGGRQASWHISPRDATLFGHVEHVTVDDYRAQWDGHTTEEKYAGIAAWTAELAERGGVCTDPAHVGYDTSGACVHGPAQD